jgi:hypothetical protein
MIRDTLKDQIEQIGKNIKRIVTKYIELPLDEEHAERIKQTNELLKEEVDLDVDFILKTTGNELVSYLKVRKLTDKNIELLADYVHQIAHNYLLTSPTEAITWYRKEIELLTVADELSKNFSMARMNRRMLVDKITQTI